MKNYQLSDQFQEQIQKTRLRTWWYPHLNYNWSWRRKTPVWLWTISGPRHSLRGPTWPIGSLPTSSVADPGCLSRIPDPDFYPFRIPDLGSPIQKQQQKRGVKKVVKPFFIATNFTKLKIILFLNAEEKDLGQFLKNYRNLFPKNLSLSSKNMGLGSGVRDPRSGIRDPEKTYSGSWIRVQGSKRHRIPDPEPQHCLQVCPSK